LCLAPSAPSSRRTSAQCGWTVCVQSCATVLRLSRWRMPITPNAPGTLLYHDNHTQQAKLPARNQGNLLSELRRPLAHTAKLGWRVETLDAEVQKARDATPFSKDSDPDRPPEFTDESLTLRFTELHRKRLPTSRPGASG